MSSRLSILAALLAGAAIAPAQQPPANPPAATAVDLGILLFHGSEPLKGTLQGMSIELPAETLRCQNCHTGPGGAAIAGSSAPALNGTMLTTAHPRRGGPPSRYTEASFCKLLRTGIDPVYIVVAREMPRYQIDDPQCASLWSYLTKPSPQ
jgi:hypothetical protein